jgi:hypothetical protein
MVVKFEADACQGITDDQAKLQMGAWAIFAAPLIMGNDVRNLTETQRAILLNRDVIAIDQDPAGALNDCRVILIALFPLLTAYERVCIYKTSSCALLSAQH